MRRLSADRIIIFSVIGLVAWTIVGLPILDLLTRPQPAKENPTHTPSADKAKRDDPWLTKDAAGFFTFLLVFVGVTQAGLFFWQLRYMRMGIDNAQVAAEAAKASAEATKSAAEATRDQVDFNFRPKIRIKHLWLSNDIWADEQVVATIVFVNVGTAVASLTEIGSATCIVDRDGTLPADPNYAKKQTFNWESQPIPQEARSVLPGVSFEIKNFNDSRVLTDADNVAIRQGKSKLYWVGYVEYKDRRGAIRKTAFCRVLELPSNATAADRGRFVKFDDPDYEYED